MDRTRVADVRRFNRFITQRIGALDDHYLSRDRALGEARVLWEIGEDGCDVRLLRSRLDLDSGYLSRLLRSLEAARLVTVQPSSDDRRVRTARLTPSGLTERAALDEASDELAWSLLAALDEARQRRLVDAMEEVERLLTEALVRIEPVDPTDPAAQHCLREYFAELDQRFDIGFDPSHTLPLPLDELRAPEGVFLVARLHDEAVGCGGLRLHGGAPPEIKRMWVGESARGLGIGRRILAELERVATARGHRTIRLETNRALTEAINLYRSSGYREVPAFNDEPYGDHWFEKRLPRPTTF